MKYNILLFFVTLVNPVIGFLVRNHSLFSTHLNKINGIQPLYSKKYEIYKLRRQKEISDAFESIFSRQRGIRIGNNISSELIQGISIMEVKLNGDCTHADIYILSSGDLFQQRQTFSWINKNLKRLRYLMAQLLSFRKNVPTLRFLPYDLESDIKDINEESEFNIIENGHKNTSKEWVGKHYGQKNDDENNENQKRKDTLIKNKTRKGIIFVESV